MAQKLNQHRAGCPPLNVLIQLNLQQSTKAGIRLEQLPELVDVMQGLHNLNFRGLMMIPEMETDFEKQRTIFRRCRQALEQLAQREPLGHNLNQLSIGMSADMEAAVAEGATQLRIGTAIFGARPISKKRP